jgi:hypothetical protein
MYLLLILGLILDLVLIFSLLGSAVGQFPSCWYRRPFYF